MFKLIIILNQIKMDKFDKVCDKKSESVFNILTFLKLINGHVQ